MQVYLVVLQVPTLDLLVFPGREEVRVPGADGKPPHCADVTSESELETTAGKFPKLLWGWDGGGNNRQ